jgi:transposase
MEMTTFAFDMRARNAVAQVRRPFGTGSSESESDVNVARMAQDLTVSMSTIYRWIKSGKLAAKKLAPIDGGRTRYFLNAEARIAAQKLAYKVLAARKIEHSDPYYN